MEKSFRNKITYINYLLSILIVFLHSNNIKGFNFKAEGSIMASFVLHFENLISNLAQIAVPCFFTISAFLFYKSFNITKLFSKYKSRFWSLGIPYLIWNSIAFMYFFFKSKINMEAVSLSLSSIFNGILKSEYSPLWFVYNLMFYILIAPIIYYILRNKYLYYVSIVVFIMLNFIYKFDYYSIVYWIPTYLLGAAMGYYFSPHIQKVPMISRRYSKKIRICSLLLFIIIFLLAYFINDFKSIYLYRLISPFLVWILIDKSLYDIKPKWWMEISFFIYCTHFILISTFQKIILLILGNSSIVTIVVYIITPIVIIFIITILAYILKKYFNVLWGICIGGR